MAFNTAFQAGFQIGSRPPPFNSGFDPSYQAVLNYATAQGYVLPSPAQRIKQNNLVLSLKAAGAWSKMDVLYVPATDGDSNFACLNYINPALYQCVPTASPIFTTNRGWKGDGVTAYVDTTFNPAVAGQYVLNNASRGMWIMTVPNSGTSLDGVVSGASNRFTYGANTAVIRINCGATNLDTNVDVSQTGLTAINRVDASNVVVCKNTTQLPRTAVSSTVTNGSQIFLGSTATRSNVEIGIYWMGVNLTAENTAMYNAMNTYISSL